MVLISERVCVCAGLFVLLLLSFARLYHMCIVASHIFDIDVISTLTSQFGLVRADDHYIADQICVAPFCQFNLRTWAS